jgi:hypothetical protein
VVDWFETMSRININSATWDHNDAKTKFLAFYKLFYEL